MKSLLTKLLFAFIIFNFSTCVFADPGDAGGITLEDPVSVTAEGLGGAYTAFADGASGSFWNPAGLNYQKVSAFEAGAMTGYEGSSLMSMGFAKPLGGGAAALNIIQYSAGDMEINMIDPSTGLLLPAQTVSAQKDTLIQAAYGRKLRNVDIGFGIKSLQSTLADEYKAATMCADLGVMLRSKDQRRSFGLAVRNIGGEMTYVSQSDAIPMTIGMGFFWRWMEKENLNVQTFLDMNQNENETHMNFGNEFLWKNLALRLGYQTGYETKSMSAGIGLISGKFKFDFSFTPMNTFDDVMRFSLSYDLSLDPAE